MTETKPREPEAKPPQVDRSLLPPGPRTPVALQTVMYGLRPNPFMTRCTRKYGDTFTVRLPGNGSIVVLSSPQAIRELFSLDADDFTVQAAAVFLEPFLGSRSLLLLDGDRHRQERKMLASSFHGNGVAAHAALVEEATRRSLSTWPTSRPFALRPHMQAITLEVILRAVFGIQFDAKYERIRSSFERFLEVGSSYLILLPPFRREFPGSSWGRFVRLRAEVHRTVHDEIAGRRKATDLEGRTDLLSLLLGLHDEDGNGLDDDSLFDELMTMLLAGQDTTATALSWAFDLLTHHPAILERLVADLDEGNEKYLNAVVKEVLRFRPVIPDVSRTLTRPMHIGGRDLPAGTTLTASIGLMHRRPDVFADPLTFRPERFLETSADYNTWIPFGGGIRRCLGAAFATMEIRVALKTILSSVSLRPARRRLERPRRRAVTFIPKTGTKVIAQPR
ncbi:MAG: cytochrome P450 [Actinomycetota bacterium]